MASLRWFFAAASLALPLAACSSTAPDLFPGVDASANASQVRCDGEVEGAPTCPGALAPSYALLDFQPKSPRFNQTYGLEAFKGKATLVGLLAGWCPYCQSQAERLNTMQQELRATGYDINFVIINKDDASRNQEAFVTRVDFPLLQDTEAVGAWALHEGQKDDFYIYDAEGTLQAYLPTGGTVSTNLSGSEGRDNLRAAIIAVAGK